MKKMIAPALVVVMFCLGCAGLAVPPPNLPLPRDPAAYLADIKAKNRSVTDVSGFAKLRIESDQKTTNSRNVFLVKRPGRIRIETLGFLSRPVLFFTADPDRMQLYAVENNSFFSGETSAENFSRIIGLPLELAEIVESFLGQPPLHDCPDKRITSTVKEGKFVFTVACGNFYERIYVDPEVRRISHYELFENGAPVYAYSFFQFQNIDGTVFPLKIKIYHYTFKAAVTLDFESLSFQAIPEERFIISPPQNVQAHALEELGGER